MIHHIFTDYELELAEIIAHIRDDPKEYYGCKLNVPITENQKAKGFTSPYEIHRIGVLAEIAVATLLRCSVRVNPIPNRGDAGFDMVWKRKFVEVKYSSHNSNPALFLRKNKENLADIYILVIGNDREMDIVGWAKPEDFIGVEPVDFGDLGKPVKPLYRNQLRPIETLPETFK